MGTIANAKVTHYYNCYNGDFIGCLRLLGFLNSKTLNWFFRCFSTNSNVNGYEVDNFPIPKITQIEQEKLSILVKKVIEGKRQDSTFDTSVMESEIDSLVYKAYCLNVEEIQIIEHSV